VKKGIKKFRKCGNGDLPSLPGRKIHHLELSVVILSRGAITTSHTNHECRALDKCAFHDVVGEISASKTKGLEVVEEEL